MADHCEDYQIHSSQTRQQQQDTDHGTTRCRFLTPEWKCTIQEIRNIALSLTLCKQYYSDERAWEKGLLGKKSIKLENVQFSRLNEQPYDWL